jgi:hypothetical protein
MQSRVPKAKGLKAALSSFANSGPAVGSQRSGRKSLGRWKFASLRWVEIMS